MVQYKSNTTKGIDMTKNIEQLKAELEAATMEALWIPNEVLPERYHDDREGGRTLDRIQEVYEREVEPNLEYQRIQAEKATRVAKYAAEYAERGEFDYDVDPDMQYKNEQSFCNGLIRGGVLDADDFMEQDVRITNLHYDFILVERR